ncbi:Alpha/Beta hydrolase protein [Aspergillus sergii]|uniref:Carboxylic ester hydrolase n=1 Tax=Aspergillus sergii TaxID=1034303 RepID=A0A5N6XQU3_9EURO|nr:Alpha/Beta hydrolase protein [Aspergillus sergii]
MAYSILQIALATLLCYFVLVDAATIQQTRAEAHPPKAKVQNGTYFGVHNDHYNIEYFLGIPFAQPPIGNLRLAPPVSLNSSFSGTRNATNLQPACVQFQLTAENKPQAATIDRAISEDCLTLNVYRPSNSGNQKLPVLVWIYGGGYTQGSNSDPRYNLTFIVNNSVKMDKPIIAVGINYRLNGFGFLGGPVIQEQGLTNLGLRDQRLALHWIQENIAGFGGDKSKVTIWGQSAGAGSVGSQLLAYGGRNDSLFRAAIADSGGPLAFKSPSNATQLQTWESILNLTGCSTASDSMACLRGVSSANFSSAVNASRGTFMPITDADFVETYSSAQLLNGQFVKVPLLTGTNTDEGTNFVGSPSYIGALPTIAYPNDTSFLDYIGQSITNTTASAAALAALSVLYPDIPAIGVPHSHKGRLNSTFGSQYARVATFAGDFMAHRGRRLSAQMWSKYNVPVYTYRFNQWPIGGLPDTTGTTHFTEVPLVQDHEVQDGYLAPWYPAGSEFAGMDSDFYALARLMSKAPIPPLATSFRCYFKTPRDSSIMMD